MVSDLGEGPSAPLPTPNALIAGESVFRLFTGKSLGPAPYKGSGSATARRLELSVNQRLTAIKGIYKCELHVARA